MKTILSLAVSYAFLAFFATAYAQQCLPDKPLNPDANLETFYYFGNCVGLVYRKAAFDFVAPDFVAGVVSPSEISLAVLTTTETVVKGVQITFYEWDGVDDQALPGTFVGASDPIPDFAVPSGSFSVVKASFSTPLALNSGQRYLLELSAPDMSTTNFPCMGTLMANDPIIEDQIFAINVDSLGWLTYRGGRKPYSYGLKWNTSCSTQTPTPSWTPTPTATPTRTPTPLPTKIKCNSIAGVVCPVGLTCCGSDCVAMPKGGKCCSVGGSSYGCNQTAQCCGLNCCAPGTFCGGGGGGSTPQCGSTRGFSSTLTTSQGSQMSQFCCPCGRIFCGNGLSPATSLCCPWPGNGSPSSYCGSNGMGSFWCKTPSTSSLSRTRTTVEDPSRPPLCAGC